jgi:hypothetical protein
VVTVLVFVICDVRCSLDHPLGDAIDVLVRREDAERFLDRGTSCLVGVDLGALESSTFMRLPVDPSDGVEIMRPLGPRRRRATDSSGRGLSGQLETRDDIDAF